VILLAKTCSACGELKMAGDFSPRPIRPVGVSSWCRPCHARYRRDPSFREQQRQATEQRRRPARVASHKRCSKCGALKPLTAFSPRNNRPSQRQSSCKDCQAARVRAAYAQSGELGRVRQAARAKAYARTLKQQVYDHYGNSCACCGSIDNLTIDHVATGAGRDFSSRRELYYWLIKSRFPPGIQVLCVSCNTSKGCGKACRLNHGPQRRRSLLECPDCGWQPVGDLKWKPEDRLRMHRRRAHEVCNPTSKEERTYRRELLLAVRRRIFEHYGERCACCGSHRNLEIDHIAGDGADHRIEVLGRQYAGSLQFYRWLVSNGFPQGYQTLCRRCNTSKGRGAHCRLLH